VESADGLRPAGGHRATAEECRSVSWQEMPMVYDRRSAIGPLDIRGMPMVYDRPEAIGQQLILQQQPPLSITQPQDLLKYT
jgi:hypothetical protein